jgi:hypothetical protein
VSALAWMLCFGGLGGTPAKPARPNCKRVGGGMPMRKLGGRGDGGGLEAALSWLKCQGGEGDPPPAPNAPPAHPGQQDVKSGSGPAPAPPLMRPSSSVPSSMMVRSALKSGGGVEGGRGGISGLFRGAEGVSTPHPAHACQEQRFKANKSPPSPPSPPTRVENVVEPQRPQRRHQLPRGDGARRQAELLPQRHAHGGGGLHDDDLWRGGGGRGGVKGVRERLVAEPSTRGNELVKQPAS